MSQTALQYFTLVHVIISLIGIASGFGALSGLLAGRLLTRWQAVFLATTVATTVTGFFFPFHGFTPAIGVGIITTLLLVVAIYAYASQKVAGKWRSAFIGSSIAALYLNCFVLVVQLFQKMPALNALAPKQTEPAFIVTHLIVLTIFIALALAALKQPHPLSNQA